MRLQRRQFLAAGLAGGPLAIAGCASSPGKTIGRVVVIGAGFGGATAAKYLRKWEPRIEVTLVERNESFVSCPLSNLVLAGVKDIDDLTLRYASLGRYGVQQVRDEAIAIDLDRKQVRLAQGDPLPYDRLIVAPGIDFQTANIPGLDAAEDSGRMWHAWKAGPQTVALRRQLEDLRNGGVFAISIPRAPYRGPAGPYERASLVAHYFKRSKRRSKILILDANHEIVSKKDLFLKAWADLYPGLIEYRPDSELMAFDGPRGVARLQAGEVKADLFNIIPPQKAGRIAQPFVTVKRQWVGVEFQGFESIKAPGVHVIGDAIAAAPEMPKSASMANNQAKVVAAAVIARLSGQPINEATILLDTGYSFVSDKDAVHAASVHKWDAAQKTLVPVPGAGGLSAARNELEGRIALNWASRIWADTLG